MDSRVRSIPPFYRDAAIAAAVFALVLAPVVHNAGPAFLRYPGFLLYFPFLFAYILLGGETESPFGPSTVHVAVYVLVLALLTAAVARVIRRRFDTSGLVTWRFLVGALLAVAGTLAALLALLAFLDLYALSPLGPGVVLLLGAVALGAGLTIAATAE
jgi:hypothetical protein